MTEHFNGLTPAEAELLALLAEKMGEAIHAIGKIFRHGYESTHPGNPNGPTNRQMLEKELGDVEHCMIRLCGAGDLVSGHIHAHADAKSVNVNR